CLNEGVLRLDRGELYRVVEGIQNVDASAAPSRVQSLRFERCIHARIVPIGNRITNVIDDRFCRRRIRILVSVPRDEIVAAAAGTERQIGPRFLIVFRVLHIQHARVEIARLAVVRTGIGNMVDGDHLEAPWRRRIRGFFTSRVDGRRERYGLTKLTPVDLAALEILHQIGDETFHVWTSCFEVLSSYADWRKTEM